MSKVGKWCLVTFTDPNEENSIALVPSSWISNEKYKWFPPTFKGDQTAPIKKAIDAGKHWPTFPTQLKQSLGNC